MVARRTLLIGTTLLLTGCAGSWSPPASPSPPDAFDPITFFAGRTEGTGTLVVAMSRPRAIHIVGTGTVSSDGTLTLVQQVEQTGKPTRTRRWQVRPAGIGKFDGMLTDAVGPVTATGVGDVLYLRFKAKHGFSIKQWLQLQPGGSVVLNHLEVRKLSVRVATLDETIRKLD